MRPCVATCVCSLHNPYTTYLHCPVRVTFLQQPCWRHRPCQQCKLPRLLVPVSRPVCSRFAFLPFLRQCVSCIRSANVRVFHNENIYPLSCQLATLSPMFVPL